MYTPASFKLSDPPRLHALMRRYPFALVLTTKGDEVAATHLPLMLDTERGTHGTLLAHMARANPHWQLFDGQSETLVVFTGAHAYISPSWYESPVTVPTWNYTVVHARGRPVIVYNKARVRAMLDLLVAEHEAHERLPWSAAQAAGYIDEQINHIVAFEIPIERLEGKFKLNQNRSRADQQGVVRALAGSGDPLKREIADLMAQNLKT